MTKTLNQLTEITELADDDLLLARDVSAVEDFKITLANLREATGVNQRTIYVGSVADLRASSGLSGEVYLQGYYGPDTEGGGNFYVDEGDTTTADEGGIVFVSADGARIKRHTDGETASPYWWGLTLTSSGDDNTSILQKVMSYPRFEFPEGFESDTLPLLAVSNTQGRFNNAKLRMLGGDGGQRSIIVFYNNPENVTYYGGVLDGNRTNVTSDASDPGDYISGYDGGMWSGDGGCHCIHVASGTNCFWYGPKIFDAETDGIYIRRDGPNKRIKNFHIFGPDVNNCSRQGLSDAGSGGDGGIDIYNAIFANTNGKAPEGGIDIEPLEEGKFADIRFHGKTISRFNSGIGFFIDPNSGANNPGTPIDKHYVYFQDLTSTGSGATSGVRITGADDKKVIMDSVKTDDFLIFAGEGDIEFEAGYIEAYSCTVIPGAGFFLNYKIGRFLCGLGFSMSTDAPFKWRGDKSGSIDYLTLINGSTATEASAGDITDGGTSIKRLDYQCSRGMELRGDGQGSDINVFVDDAMLNDNIILDSSATGWRITVSKSVNDDEYSLKVDGDGNIIDILWPNASSTGFRCSGSKNVITMKMPGGTAALGSLTNTSSDNLLANCYYGTDNVVDAGTGNVVVGSFPLSRNT